MNIYKLIIAAEKSILFFIALLTVFSVFNEMYTVIQNGKINLTDLLLMFIYAEVLSMWQLSTNTEKFQSPCPFSLPLRRSAD